MSNANSQGPDIAPCVLVGNVSENWSSAAGWGFQGRCPPAMFQVHLPSLIPPRLSPPGGKGGAAGLEGEGGSYQEGP